ncbi:hypothetical protein [Chryseobacterium sp. ERMR1:04]|uniref:hypothetical protein n=1 Tax=Chryseobacterium sp. ERMR1:04 TaxID=1705393 RepID=UPI000AA0AC0E|nr:hypothetical protein [Chryseobacterium sp. ERMR1:04]
MSNTQDQFLKIKTPLFGLVSNGTIFTKVIPNTKINSEINSTLPNSKPVLYDVI